ncbi:hypothetical protein C8A03DRAFT_31098 [Achaetomium macrosporum]|uniref:2EXR domain-containing protein n=1 Tax=Achaetomium macrosporum TaxID=79813 RepID=A0AAN7CGF1_9PEZI|nr:hypothetical protein C8A03DRAFT_31098 [Achaetomium macrosporum]
MHHDQLFPRLCPMQTADRFPKFQRLPPEIRNMIWEYALPEARVYEVLDAPNAKQKTPAQEGLMFANVHPEPPPALAAVCRESRHFVLHHYKPLTLGRTTKYVDMSRDILLLEPYLLVKRLHRTLHFMSQIPLVRDKATRLALGTSYGIYPGIFHPVLGRKVSKRNMSKLLASLAKFPRLKTLIFVVHQEFQFEFDFRFPGTLTAMPNYSPSLMGSPSALAGPGASTVYTSQLTSSNSSAPSTNTRLLSPYSGSPTATTTTVSHSPGNTDNRTATSPSSLTFNTSSPFQTTTTTTTTTLPPGYAMLHPLPSSVPAPVPVPTRPQQVHQAYRFKFDIESNINSPPRRPHTNELLYYPLDIKEDYDDDDADYGAAYGSLCTGFGSGSGLSCGGYAPNAGGGGKRWEDCVLLDNADEEEEEDAEWCDPWPTNDDWRRFRRRWVRSMLAACAGTHNHGGGGAEAEGQQQNGGRAASGKGCATAAPEGKGIGGPGKGRVRVVCLPTFKVKGASLLWRYTRGVGGGSSVRV